ncbi:S-layer like family, C-terminal region [Candidatus Methanophagaceae archaeon]|nr:S-layer like family, C-terminal region [Methanophagales archaeon]
MRKSLLIGGGAIAAIAIVITAIVLSGVIEQEEELVLSNYPKLFGKEVVIVIGENATQMEYESAEAIAENLENITGNKPKVYISEKTESLKYTYNLIILGTPNSNEVLKEVCKMANVTRVTDEYPGENKGILEILKNPWNEDKAMLLVEGSDEWGVKAGVVVLAGSQELNKHRLSVEWGESGGTPSPFLSKIDAALDLLLTLRGEEQIPEEMKEIVISNTVNVSINFTHELNTSEIQLIEELGVKFARLHDGEIAHSGTIYGAEIPWDRTEDLAELESVVRIESAWQLGIENPANLRQRKGESK